MYSPKIAEDLIPRLYWRAKSEKVSMTKLVDGIIRSAVVAKNSVSFNAGAETGASLFVRESDPRDAA